VSADTDAYWRGYLRAAGPGRCPTPCDDDCDADCHEGHQPYFKHETPHRHFDPVPPKMYGGFS